jgi:trigger factor
VPFDGGSAVGFDLERGSGMFISGFEDGLIGKNIGQTVVLKLTFPKQYHSIELAGQEVVFSVKINSVIRIVPAKLDNEFVRNHTEYRTVKQFEDAIKAELKEAKEAEAVYMRETLLWGEIVENSPILGYPDKELKASIDENDGYYKDMASSSRIEWSDFLVQYGITQEEYDAFILEGAQQQVAQEMILIAIARQEELEPSKEEYEEGKLEILTAMGFDSEKAYKDKTGESLEQAFGKKTIQLITMFEKVMRFIDENAVIK